MVHAIENFIRSLAEISPYLSYIFLFAVIFAETGLMVGFFLPGDSLLFTVGFLASQFSQQLNIIVLCLTLFVAAVIGDSVGYMFGHKFGKRLFNKEDSFWFHKDHLLKAQKFYEKHGGKTIIFARFLPAIRTFAPIVAGIGSMEYKKFLLYNIVGGFFWTVGLLVAGFYLGRLIPADKVDLYLVVIVLVIIFLSVAPGIYHASNTKEKRQKIVHHIRSLKKKPSQENS